MGFGMFSVKLVAASAAVFSSAVALRLATPAVAKFLFEEAPRFCESLSAWLTPPYLYFVINGIIISIAATSRLQKAITAPDHSNLSAPPTAVSEYDNPATAEYIPTVAEEANLRPELLAPAIGSDAVVDFSLAAAEANSEEGFVISRSSWSPRKRGSNEDLPEILAAAGTGGGSTEKPPFSTRLGRRRSIKSSPEAGKPLGVSRPKKHETLESTWRAITDGRPVPLAHHLKKSDTWETHARATSADVQPPPPPMLKSETFSTRSVAGAAGLSSQSSPSGSFSPTAGKLRRESLAGKIRREPSLGQDDLNRRVEAFIRKFNEEMRLQRQNSLQQYMDMINRSSH